jgi:hypothetical protein
MSKAIEIAQRHHRPGVKLRSDHWAVRLAEEALAEGEKAGYERGVRECKEWMRVHLSGLGSPNEEDLAGMDEWLRAQKEPA